MSPGTFRAREVVAALVSATLAQGAFLLVFSASAPELRADDTPGRPGEVAVSVTPIGLPKLGGGSRHARTRGGHSGQHPATYSTAARDSLASGPQIADEAAASPTPDTDAAAPASSAPEGDGTPDGVENGTEADPLKAHAVALYRAQLSAWFLSRFNVRGKIPFDTLKTLRAVASISIPADRTVGGYSLVAPSGNAVFDREVGETLSAIQASGATLPAPPPMYPNILGGTLAVSFRCTVQSQCE